MQELPLPKFHEALLNDDEEYKVKFDAMVKGAGRNPWINQYLEVGMKEGIFSDMAAALGKIHDTVVEAAKPKLIARNILDTRTSTEALERFIRAKKSVAYVGGEGAIARVSGERYDTVDIKTNVIVKDSVFWSKELAEDASWNVMSRQLEELGRSVADMETAKIIALFEAIAAGDLATGAVIAGGAAVLSWAKTAEMWDAVEFEDFEADTMFMHSRQMGQLFTATEFINSQYMPSSGMQMGQGRIGQAITMALYKSSKCTNGKIFGCSKYPAGVLLIRRDLTTEDFADPRANQYGVVASERIGYGILRSKAVAGGTNFKTTFT
jgi:hypothetical protein